MLKGLLVRTHVLSSVETERVPAMCGKATLAIEVSSTSMKVAIVTVSAISQGLNRGVYAATSVFALIA